MTALRVWAPAAISAEADVEGARHALRPGGAPGWWVAADLDVGAGVDYSFRLDQGDPLPDPRSCWQPHGCDGPSRSYDHSAFRWTDQRWRGRPLAGAVIYELHVGTFTAEGTFAAALRRLSYLRELGVDMIELMPVAAFPGRHGWGYDGVGLWAVHEPYGGPDGLKQFVDACHARGLAVMLDVVYNHAGPGNRLAEFGPYFTSAHSTPWGPALNLDQPGSDEVRAFLLDNAAMWLRDYHVDGLRLDAVHGLRDERARHFLEELGDEVHALAASLGRELVLVAETNRNDPRLVTAAEAGGYGLAAEWSDDFHHAVHAAVTGERAGPYCDFGSVAAIAKTLTAVFYHDGSWSKFWGRGHGRPVDVQRTPGDRFVGYLQNHDQVGNRAAGERISALIPADLVKVAAGLTLTAPFTPLLFMGEEWGATTPWQYFTDHTDPVLAGSIGALRRAEFAAFGWADASIPDPQDEATVAASRLDWYELARSPHKELLAWYRALIALRRSRPELTDSRLDRVRADYDEEQRWLVLTRGGLRIVASLGEQRCFVPLGAEPTAILLASANEVRPRDNGVELPGACFAVVATRGGEPAT